MRILPIVIISSILLVILLTGCSEIDVGELSEEDLQKITGQVIACNEPYMRHAAGCCLDKNNNKICDDDETSKEIKETKPPAEQDNQEENNRITSEGYTLGDPDAQVTIIEYGDFQCPFCGHFYSETLPELKEQYIDTGKAKITYKHFPLSSIHALAKPAAIASHCAQEQGKFWEYHNLLFETQATLSENTFEELANDIGLNEEEFNQCRSSIETEEYVENDISKAKALGVSGTPTFFINGKELVGARPVEDFETIIQEQLAP